jgi:hypothetical protein
VAKPAAKVPQKAAVKAAQVKAHAKPAHKAVPAKKAAPVAKAKPHAAAKPVKAVAKKPAPKAGKKR